MNKKNYLLAGFVIGVLAFILFLFNTPITSTQPLKIGRLATTWEGTELNSDQNSLGIFEVETVCVTSKEMLFFYAISNSQNIPFNVIINSSNRNDDSKLQILDVLQVESLGKLGEYDIGVIHTSWINSPNQLLKLQIKPSAGNARAWFVEPLIQQLDAQNPDSQNGIFILFPKNSTNITISNWNNLYAISNNKFDFLMSKPNYKPLRFAVNRISGEVSRIA